MCNRNGAAGAGKQAGGGLGSFRRGRQSSSSNETSLECYLNRSDPTHLVTEAERVAMRRRREIEQLMCERTTTSYAC